MTSTPQTANSLFPNMATIKTSVDTEPRVIVNYIQGCASMVIYAVFLYLYMKRRHIQPLRAREHELTLIFFFLQALNVALWTVYGPLSFAGFISSPSSFFHSYSRMSPFMRRSCRTNSLLDSSLGYDHCAVFLCFCSHLQVLSVSSSSVPQDFLGRRLFAAFFRKVFRFLQLPSLHLVIEFLLTE